MRCHHPITSKWNHKASPNPQTNAKAPWIGKPDWLWSDDNTRHRNRMPHNMLICRAYPPAHNKFVFLMSPKCLSSNKRKYKDDNHACAFLPTSTYPSIPNASRYKLNFNLNLSMHQRLNVTDPCLKVLPTLHFFTLKHMARGLIGLFY